MWCSSTWTCKWRTFSLGLLFAILGKYFPTMHHQNIHHKRAIPQNNFWRTLGDSVSHCSKSQHTLGYPCPTGQTFLGCRIQRCPWSMTSSWILPPPEWLRKSRSQWRLAFWGLGWRRCCRAWCPGEQCESCAWFPAAASESRTSSATSYQSPRTFTSLSECSPWTRVCRIRRSVRAAVRTKGPNRSWASSTQAGLFRICTRTLQANSKRILWPSKHSLSGRSAGTCIRYPLSMMPSQKDCCRYRWQLRLKARSRQYWPRS